MLMPITWPQTVSSLERRYPPWIFRGKSADLIQLPKLVLGEGEFNRCEIVLKLVEAFRANNNRGHQKSHASERRAGLHPCAFAIGAITSRMFARIAPKETRLASIANRSRPTAPPPTAAPRR